LRWWSSLSFSSAVEAAADRLATTLAVVVPHSAAGLDVILAAGLLLVLEAAAAALAVL